MPKLPRIYIFHASDAVEQIDALKRILHRMKAEHRIGDFTFFTDMDELATLQDRVALDDAIITLLTLGLKQPDEAKRILRQLKLSRPKFKVGEIIIDPLSYENTFISFPSDLKAIRERANLDQVWDKIERKLQDLFPVQSTPEPEGPKPVVDWKTILKYAVPLVVVVALVLWYFFGNNNDDRITQKDTTEPAVTEPATPVEDDGPDDAETPTLKAEFSSDMKQCDAPCTVMFTNMSENADKYQWDFGDGNPNEEQNPSHTFNSAGQFQVKLTAFRNNEQNVVTHPITITTPTAPPVNSPAPVAIFTPSKTDCLIPCTVTFSNQSQNASSFRWDFGEGTPVTDRDPTHRYTTAGEHRVTLVAINDQQVENATVAVVTVKGSYPVGAYTFRTSGADAQKVRGDYEIDSDDWTNIEAEYSLHIVQGREVQLRVTWFSQECESNKTPGDTRFRSTKAFTVFNVESCCPGAVIDAIEGIERTARQERFYQGQVHDFKQFPNFGSMTGLEVRFDGPGDNDEPRQGFRGTLQAFTVRLKAAN